MDEERAQVIADRTLDARLAERRRTASLILPALLVGAACVGLMPYVSHATLYALHISAALGGAMWLGALEVDHERPFLWRELRLGVSGRAMLGGKMRGLVPLALAQGVLLCLPYVPFGVDIAPPGWLILVTLCASILGLIQGLAAAAVGVDRRWPLGLTVGVTLVQAACAAGLVHAAPQGFVWGALPNTSLASSLWFFERSMEDGDTSSGFIMTCVATAVWAKLLWWVAAASFERMASRQAC